MVGVAAHGEQPAVRRVDVGQQPAGVGAIVGTDRPANDGRSANIGHGTTSYYRPS